MRKFKAIKARIEKVLSMSSVHGIPNIIQSDKISIKSMWFLCLLASTGLCAYFISKSAIDYSNFDVITQYAVINEAQSQFPSISFCSDPHFENNFQLESSIVHCYMNMNTKCRTHPTEYFLKYNDSYYKTCFRFNSNNDIIANSTQSGHEFGLRVGLKLENPIKNKYRNLIIHIHNNSLIPLNLYNKGYHIAPGIRYFFNIERTYIQLLEYPYNDCLKDPNDFTKNKTIIDFIQKSAVYTQKLCYELCFELAFLENNSCSCAKELGHVIKDCVENTCGFDFREKFYRSNIEDYCYKYCPLECDSVHYNIIQSNYMYPYSGAVLNEKLPNFTSNEEVKMKYYEFYIYYSELKYVSISQTPKTQPADLVSNIGGILGLFIGVSFLSFIEIFEVVLEIIFTLHDGSIAVKR